MISIHAQKINNLNVRLVKNFKSDKSSLTNQMISFFSLPDLYYFTNEDWRSEDSTLRIFKMNLENGKKDSLEIIIPSSIIINELPDISINENYLILCDDDNFNFYRYVKSEGKFIYSNKIILPDNSCGRYMRYLGNDCFLINTIYNFHPEQNLFNSNIGVYDAKNNVIKNFIHPDLPCIGFSHLNHSWVTNNDKLIAIADPCGYKISIYNFNLEKTDSINYTPSTGWTNLSKNTIPVETNPAKVHPKILIDQLHLMEDTVSRIEKIFFLDDSRLLVSSTCNHCGNNYRRIDIWETGKWQEPVYSHNRIKIQEQENDTINLNDLPVELKNPVNLSIKDNFIYRIYDDDFYPKENISVKEFNHQKDLYYEKNDPQFSFGIYKITLH